MEQRMRAAKVAVARSRQLLTLRLPITIGKQQKRANTKRKVDKIGLFIVFLYIFFRPIG